QMNRIQSTRWLGKGLQRAREYGRRKFYERQPPQQRAHFIRVRPREFAGVNAGPNLILDNPAGDKRLSPQPFRRRAVFRQEMCERNRGVEVNQRSFRSSASSFCSLRKDVTGLRGGGVDADRAGGVIPRLRTAWAREASC